MDGVLIDAMLFHAEAMRLAIREETKHDINNKVSQVSHAAPLFPSDKEFGKCE